ncbi:hypothetical protein V6N13_065749 [Hibiscus sabdariffa]
MPITPSMNPENPKLPNFIDVSSISAIQCPVSKRSENGQVSNLIQLIKELYVRAVCQLQHHSHWLGLSNAKLLQDRFGHQIDACTKITQGFSRVVVPNGAWYSEAPGSVFLADTVLCIMARHASVAATVSNSPNLIFLDTMSLRNLA